MPGIVRNPRHQLISMLANVAFITFAFPGMIESAQGETPVTPGELSKLTSGDQKKEIAAIKSLTRDAMKEYNLKALIVQVTAEGRRIYTDVLGESMSGVPATPAMHFRNGAMAFTYISTLLPELVDQKKLTLDDKLSKFLPDLPQADRITLKNLANMTSGYADYVYEPEVLQGIYLDPFRQLDAAGTHQDWRIETLDVRAQHQLGYGQTNYVILGQVVAQVTHMSLA